MNTECFIKSLMLIIVILLMISCLQTTENFGEIDFTKIQPKKSIGMTLTTPANEVYYLVSYDQLNKDKQEAIRKKLLEDATKFIDLRDSKSDVEKGTLYKTPVFLVGAGQIDSLTNSKLNFVLTAEAGAYALTPEISGTVIGDKYLFFNKDLGLAYYAKEGLNSDIVYINKSGFVKSFGIQKSGPFSNLNLNTFLLSDSDKVSVNISQN